MKTAAKEKTVVFQGLKIKIDRPKGFEHEGKDKEGRPWKRIYKVDYGYFPRTDGGDGEGIDVFVGPDESCPTTWWVRQVDDKGNFDEWKVLVGYHSRDEAKRTYFEHIPRKFFGGIVSIPIGFVQSMTNVGPSEKTATLWALYDELEKISGAPQ